MGDLARSPRMLNHARELAANGFAVVLIGYRGRKFKVPEGVRVRKLDGGHSAPRSASGMRFLLAAVRRMGRLFFALFFALLRERPRWILLQNPPSFPTLTASTLAAKWLRSKVIVDWHNYGFSLLALRLGPSHWLTRLARSYEFRAGRRATRHLCVSRAMRDNLLSAAGIRASVLNDRPLYDRPPHPANPLPHQFVAVCPAGWTSDEDIELLLDALDQLPDSALRVCITGDGAKRAELAPRLRALRARGLLSDTGFLPEADYLDLLRRADVGLSLHRSSSGLDLAMKVVDLLGVGIPVCVLDYGACLREQIEAGVTGFPFRTAAELAALLARLSSDPAELQITRAATRDRQTPTWNAEWKRVALPLLEEARGASASGRETR
jgi:beta-1,4-mannosyltransferase